MNDYALQVDLKLVYSPVFKDILLIPVGHLIRLVSHLPSSDKTTA